MHGLWLRWTWRDFRGRWVQILTTSLILAVGVGAVAGLGGLRAWREQSAAKSLTSLKAHDLRFDLAGEGVATGRLATAAGDLGVGSVAAAEERLVAETQVDASRPGHTVLVPGRLIGVPVRRGGQRVDALAVKEGSDLGNGRAALLDWSFGHYYGLPPSGTLRVADAGTIRYTGQGVSPQYLLIADASGLAGGEVNLAVLYLPLEEAQRITGRAGMVNELVLRLVPGTDAGAVERRVRAALPGHAMTVTHGADEAAQRLLFRDARSDQKLYLAFAALLLVGAAFATFNLVSRVVQAQRREIGIGMALGARPRTLAVRPLALGMQIAVLGVLLGLPVGIGLAELIKSLMRSALPLPAYASAFPTGFYLLGAAIGALVPLCAAVLPVRAAVRVAPIEAIRIGHHAAKGGGLSPLLRRLPIPGGSLALMPLRNLARAPKRTMFTLFGLSVVIAVVVGVSGMVDSIADTAKRQNAAVLRQSPNRLQVDLTDLEPANGPVVRSIQRARGVGHSEPGLTVGATLRGPKGEVPVGLGFVDAATRLWRPSVVSGRATADGILLARKAASDLGVGVGDVVEARHPRRVAGGLADATTRVRVSGIHDNPLRALAYVDASAAARFGLAGLASTVTVLPAPNVPSARVEHALFGRTGVASVRPVAADVEATEHTIEAFSGAIRMVAFITLGLALLVAFTSTSVSLDERRREYATMFAFGVRPRSAIRIAIAESVVTGLFGTLLGLALGLAATGWIVRSLLPEVYPELGAQVTLTVGSVLTTALVGIVAVGLAPLFTLRRLRAMDIPSTLRVME